MTKELLCGLNVKMMCHEISLLNRKIKRDIDELEFRSNLAKEYLQVAVSERGSEMNRNLKSMLITADRLLVRQR